MSESADLPSRGRARFSPASMRALEAVERRVIASSESTGWTSVLVDHHTVSPDGNVVEAPATPDQTLVVVVGGRQEIEVLGEGPARRAPYRAGTSGLTPAGTSQRLRRLPVPGGGTVEKVNVYLPAALIDEVAEHYRRAGTRLRTARLSALAWQDRTTADAVLALARAAAAGAPDLYGQAGALWLATHLLTPDLRAPAVARVDRRSGALTERRLRAVLDLIDAHHAEDLTLERLAAEASISTFHFVRLFRQATGTTPHAHLVGVRLAAAHALLLESDLSVSQVASRCGFGRANHFSTAFKARFGCSPSNLRACSRQAR